MLKKPTVFSGAQPSGYLTIGNYIGAIKQWVNMQDDNNCFYCIVDLHAITSFKEPKFLKKMTFTTLATYLACGLSPEKSTIFIQSHIPEHTQLNWILNCYTSYGELCRMTQFKEKSQQFSGQVNVGILNYPVLMASDILLYQASKIPVGEDQKQHLELVQNIAKKFNMRYGKIFKIPQPFIQKKGSRIMSLLDPNKKMSKSDVNKKNVIYLLDEPNIVIKKIRNALTDSDSPAIINYDNIHKKGISNLLSIFSEISGQSILDLEEEFKDKTYSFFKKSMSESLADFLSDFQKRYYYYYDNKDFLNQIILEGAKKAKNHVKKTIKKVFDTIGLIT
ncbi:tryptophan--tRNA ligase [Candidatus Tachikawaea gelatinosa]|uniref:Tryptophan--tRNA ligase n=1 Tax=Candidatus Tachikawaea gelatinosa TaxID=1410383 RepID=A0A090AQE7_9ENTR|nr:tryptophan--tRNA ligase [Candidatus Tachikawaea gelatinosa]BAP58572.1 tryptophan--tRNA ligase [Candidatus Tachikawaea gelatinosa]